MERGGGFCSLHMAGGNAIAGAPVMAALPAPEMAALPAPALAAGAYTRPPFSSP
jgi:hypothetical protein